VTDYGQELIQAQVKHLFQLSALEPLLMGMGGKLDFNKTTVNVSISCKE